MEKIENPSGVFDLVLMTKSAVSTVSDKNKGHISKEEKEYLLSMQEYLFTVLKLCKWRVMQKPVDKSDFSTMTVRTTEDWTLQDYIFGELPYVIISGAGMISKFITRDNIPRFLSVWTTINNWMTDKQKKSWEWIEHNLLNKNPAFRLLPQVRPSSTKTFLAKFYRISTEFDTVLYFRNNI